MPGTIRGAGVHALRQAQDERGLETQDVRIISGQFLRAMILANPGMQGVSVNTKISSGISYWLIGFYSQFHSRLLELCRIGFDFLF